jgi:hypothetical protein
MGGAEVDPREDPDVARPMPKTTTAPERCSTHQRRKHLYQVLTNTLPKHPGRHAYHQQFFSTASATLGRGSKKGRSREGTDPTTIGCKCWAANVQWTFRPWHNPYIATYVGVFACRPIRQNILCADQMRRIRAPAERRLPVGYHRLLGEEAVGSFGTFPSDAAAPFCPACRRHAD